MALPTTFALADTHLSQKSYFLSRLEELSQIAGREITEAEARRQYGITYDEGGALIYRVDKATQKPILKQRRVYTDAGPQWEPDRRKPGGILIEARRYDSQPFAYVPVQHRKALKKIEARKSSYEAHTSQFYDTFKRLRVHPDQVKGAKYISPPLQRIPSLPMPLVQAAFAQATGMDCLTFVEGELKAAALDLRGMPTVGFAGIGMYRLDEDLRDLLERCRPPEIRILYDGDALNARRDKTSGRVTTRRPEDFYNSACRFAAELFEFYREIGHKGKLSFVMINPDLPHKGVDDLLLATGDDKDAVIEALRRGRSGSYFRCLPLSRTTYEARLRRFFHLHDPGEFWKTHRAEIGGEPFDFEGNTFQRIPGGLLMPARSGERPQGQKLRVDTYLQDGAEVLDSLLASEQNLAIAAPTGSGKTTFLVTLAKRTGRRILLCVPTRNQCRQLQKDYPEALAIMGRRDQDRAADSAAHKVVFCTYDTAHHVPDLGKRILVIDEAHQVINAYRYRAEALNRLLWCAERAQQVVYLSATMPTALVDAFKLPTVDVERKNNPQVRLHRIKAAKDSPQAISEALAAQLVAGLRLPGCQYALFNNTQLCEALREYLIAGGHVSAHEILVMSAKGRDAGDKAGFDYLEKSSRIPAEVRIVLSTSIIAEGINIKNEDVSRVYAAGLNCPDTVRQYIARFRRMETTDLFLITKPTDRPGHKFGTGSAEGWYLSMLRDQAAVAALAYNTQLHAGERVTRSLPEHFLKPNEERDGYEVDHLAILQADKQRILDSAPPAYLIGQLLTYPGFALYTEDTAVVSEQQSTDLQAAKKARKLALDAYLACLRITLTTGAGLPIAALGSYYKEKGDRHRSKRLQAMAGGLIASVPVADAVAWREENRPWLEHKEVTELIRRAALLEFAGVEDLAAWVALSAAEWRQEWRRAKVFFGREAMELNERALPVDLRIELRARDLIARQVQEFLDTDPERVTDADLLEIVKRVFTVADGRSGVLKSVCLRDLSKGKAVQLVAEIFEVQTVRQGSGYAVEVGAQFEKYRHEPLLAPISPRLNDNPLLISILRL